MAHSEMPDRIYAELDPDTNAKRWYSTKGMGDEYVRATDDGMVRLTLDHNEAQAILNALRESGVLGQKMVFHHVDTLRRKTERAMTAAGFPPIGS